MSIVVPRLRVMQMHICAVRMCGLVYFFAFLGNVIDGPILWLTMPPGRGNATDMVFLNKCALVPAVSILFRPRWWPALAVCWLAWHHTVARGGSWFFFGWDQMMDEIGFLSALLSVTLSLYDTQAPDPCWAESRESDSDTMANADAEENDRLVSGDVGAGVVIGATAPNLRARQAAARPAAIPFHVDYAGSGTPHSQTLLVCQLLWGQSIKAKCQLELCKWPVMWAREISEIALTLAGFRLFLAAGLIKKRVGSQCWKNWTCLYDHFETQPMPNPVAWYFHNYMPHSLLSVIQFFAIDLCECVFPFLLLSFVLSQGPLGIIHRQLRQDASPLIRRVASFPGRFVGASFIMLFVLGMFCTGNYAFLHPLSIVSLIASMGTDRGVPMVTHATSCSGSMGLMQKWYRRTIVWLVIILHLFAFLPSIEAYSWLAYGNEYEGSSIPGVGPLIRAPLTQEAQAMNLGTAYNHHAYFAGAVHQRNEMILFVDLGSGELQELDIPCKVGKLERAPCVTSPLHRRFAWQWWFLSLGTDATFLEEFMDQLCLRNPKAWAALERSFVHERLQDVRRVVVQMYQYHYSGPGTSTWWTRVPTDVSFKHECGLGGTS